MNLEYFSGDHVQNPQAIPFIQRRRWFCWGWQEVDGFDR
jgi:hypothetical protein